MIEGVGPRYCPSIEDKVVRFSDKERHQIFVEPCGLDTEEMYLQGMSSSLPEDVQKDVYKRQQFPRRADGKTMTAACSAAIDCGLHTFLLFSPL